MALVPFRSDVSFFFQRPYDFYDIKIFRLFFGLKMFSGPICIFQNFSLFLDFSCKYLISNIVST